MSGVRRDCRCKRARHQHGTKLAYNADGCRCGECRAAVVAHNRAYYRRRTELRWAGRSLTTEGAGTRRRLRALAALGWTSTQLGISLGVTPQAVQQVACRDRPVRLSTAERVATLYDELSMQRPSPWTWVNARCARRAAARGWLPPLAWDDDTIDYVDYIGCAPAVDFILNDPPFQGNTTSQIPDDIDEIAVERAMRGDRVRLTRAETSEAIARLARMKLSDAEIADRIGLSRDAVCKQRERHGIAPGVPSNRRSAA